ncbi:MAG: hypothetical protein J6T20_08650 [Treponema sp.]|nr:hypothetical protein [Treponema sp.]
MNYKIEIPSLKLDFKVPPSKSVVHRELIIGFLEAVKEGRGVNEQSGVPERSVVPEALEGPQKIQSIITPQETDNDDIRATRACLKALYEAGQSDATEVFMPCNESGSTLRFMISVGAAYLNYVGLAQKKKLVFLPKGRLIDRPLDQLITCLAARGVTVVADKEKNEITVEGQLTPGCFVIQGNVSSQYISGLQMALILLPDFTVELDGELESRGYYDLTLQVLKEHGTGNGEGDWSSAAFLLCLGALVPDGQVVLHGLNKDSLQKDKIIISILEQLGFAFTWNNSSVELTARPDVNKARELELNLDAADYPDIVPYIAIVAAAYAKSTSIKNIERLHFKECDRVEATINALKAAGGNAYEKEGTLYITGGHNATGELCVNTYGDHRMAMTACLVAAWTGLPVLIDNKECVNKSFPGLFTVIASAAKQSID